MVFLYRFVDQSFCVSFVQGHLRNHQSYLKLFFSSPFSQYHPDLLAIFQQVEKEGGPKMSWMDENQLGLQITIMHLHRAKSDAQKMLKVTQEQLWVSDTQTHGRFTGTYRVSQNNDTHILSHNFEMNYPN